MNYIIFLSNSGFFKRDYKRFFINKLEKKYNILFFDLTKIFHRRFYNENKNYYFKNKSYKSISSIQHIKKILSKKKILFVFDLVSPEFKQVNVIRKLINSKKINLIQFQTSNMPMFKRSLVLKIKYLFRIIFFNQKLLLFYIKKILNIKIFSKMKNYSYFYNYVFCASLEGEKKEYTNSDTKLIYGHSLDYDNFLKKKNLNKNLNKNFFLFTDQYLPHHNAYASREIPPFVTADKYYKSINKFFYYLEEKYKIKIIISAHPRSKYNLIGNKFEGRKIVNYTETEKYTALSKGVINYSSTSMSYAVIYKKPLIFYTTNELINSHDAYHVNFLSKQTGSTLINIDKIDSKNKINDKYLMHVNKYKYKIFFDKYIKHTLSDNTNNFKKILDIIKI